MYRHKIKSYRVKCNHCLNVIPVDNPVYTIDTTKSVYCQRCYEKHYKPYFDRVQGKYVLKSD